VCTGERSAAQSTLWAQQHSVRSSRYSEYQLPLSALWHSPSIATVVKEPKDPMAVRELCRCSRPPAQSPPTPAHARALRSCRASLLRQTAMAPPPQESRRCTLQRSAAQFCRSARQQPHRLQPYAQSTANLDGPSEPGWNRPVATDSPSATGERERLRVAGFRWDSHGPVGCTAACRAAMISEGWA
jgi:hypothetical protein